MSAQRRLSAEQLPHRSAPTASSRWAAAARCPGDEQPYSSGRTSAADLESAVGCASPPVPRDLRHAVNEVVRRPATSAVEPPSSSRSDSRACSSSERAVSCRARRARRSVPRRAPGGDPVLRRPAGRTSSSDVRAARAPARSDPQRLLLAPAVMSTTEPGAYGAASAYAQFPGRLPVRVRGAASAAGRIRRDLALQRVPLVVQPLDLLAKAILKTGWPRARTSQRSTAASMIFQGVGRCRTPPLLETSSPFRRCQKALHRADGWTPSKISRTIWPADDEDEPGEEWSTPEGSKMSPRTPSAMGQSTFQTSLPRLNSLSRPSR